LLTDLKNLEPRYTNFVLNCQPNRSGVLDEVIVNRLKQIGKNWKANPDRAPLPPQPDVMNYPIDAKSATATSVSDKNVVMNAIDGLHDFINGVKGTESLWIQDKSKALPQSVTLDLGDVYSKLNMATYIPPHWTDDVKATNDRNTVAKGTITAYNLYVSTDGNTFTKVNSGKLDADRKVKTIEFTPVSARYVKFEATEALGDFAAVSEFTVGSSAQKIEDKPQQLHPEPIEDILVGGKYLLQYKPEVTDYTVQSNSAKVEAISTSYNGIKLDITQADATGTAIINATLPNGVTSTDGSSQKTYKIHFTSASASTNSSSTALFVGSNKALINGQISALDVAPIIKDGRTLVPVRFISEALGAKVDWDGTKQEVMVTSGSKIIKLVINSNKINISGKDSTLDVSAQIISGRTMVPFRALAQALDKTVFWDASGLIIISDTDMAHDKTTLDGIINTLK
jgi:hypothetical protein